MTALVLLPPLKGALAALLEGAYSYRGARDTLTKVHTRAADTRGRVATVSFACPGDAGIHCTALLAAETALGMLEAPAPLPAGMMTPVLALGVDALAARLRGAGVVISSRGVGGGAGG